MSTGLSRHKLALVWAAIVNQGAGREGGRGHPGLTNNVSVSLDKQVNIDLVENYTQSVPSPGSAH